MSLGVIIEEAPPLGQCRVTLGHVKVFLEPPWSHLGQFWKFLGARLRHLGDILERVWANLEPSWTILGLSWGNLGTISGHLGALYIQDVTFGEGMQPSPKYDRRGRENQALARDNLQESGRPSTLSVRKAHTRRVWPWSRNFFNTVRI